MVEKTKKTKLTVASDDDAPRYSRDTPHKEASNQTTLDVKTGKRKTDAKLLRNTAASIADALLRLGDSDDTSNNSTCAHSKKNRKRSVSLIDESDSCSTQSIDTETDSSSTGTAKRRRKTSQEVCTIPTKVCLATSNIPSLRDDRIVSSSNLSSSGKDTKIEHKSSNIDIPGNIGCISQFFHQAFRPLPAAPRMPREIVPETPPPMQSFHFPYTPSATKGPLCSTEITEHKDCLIMHSYTVLPRNIPYQMTQIQVPNGYWNLNRRQWKGEGTMCKAIRIAINHHGAKKRTVNKFESSFWKYNFQLFNVKRPQVKHEGINQSSRHLHNTYTPAWIS